LNLAFFAVIIQSMKNIKSHTVFFSLALIGLAVLLIFVYLAKRELNSYNLPNEKITQFYKYKNYLTIGNFIVFLFLLFTANIMYIRQRYWDTFIWAGIIFVSFALIDWWWLGNMIFEFKKQNNIDFGELSIGPFVGIMIALFGLGLAIGNYMLLKRIVVEKKILPTETEEVEDKKE
jgi:uncharacterized membrane protein YGL010W